MYNKKVDHQVRPTNIKKINTQQNAMVTCQISGGKGVEVLIYTRF